jgi:hypothetical protein
MFLSELEEKMFWHADSPTRSAMATIHSWQKKWGVMVDICTFWSVPRRWFCFQRDGNSATLPVLLKRTKLSHDDRHPANCPDSLTQFSEVTLIVLNHNPFVHDSSFAEKGMDVHIPMQCRASEVQYKLRVSQESMKHPY